MAAIVTSYAGYRVSETEGRIEFHGTGFGAAPGRVVLVQNRQHVGDPVTYESWSDTKIVAIVPSYVYYRSFIIVPSGGGPFVATNINPQISTYTLQGLIFDTATSPGSEEVLVTGSGLGASDRLQLVTDAGNLNYWNPAGPNAIDLQYPSASILAWIDGAVNFTDTQLSGKTATKLTAFDVAQNPIGEFDFPDFLIS